MPSIQHQITTIPFSGLMNWSVRYLRENLLRYKKEFRLYRIGDFLDRNRKQVEIKDDVNYRRVTVRLYNKGVIERDAVKGNTIGTKRQFVVSEGQFIMSKIDARNAAFGLVPKELEGAIVTADFLSYNVDKTKIDPQFLTFLTSTNQFVSLCQSASSGTTGRQRVQESTFLNFQIPLPSLLEQQRIVTAYNSRIRHAHELEEKAQQIEKEVEFFLMKKLKIKLSSKEERKDGLQLVAFKDLARWDTLFLLGNIHSYRSEYPSIKIGQLIERFMEDDTGKSLRVETFKFPQKDFFYIGMEHLEKDTGNVIDTPKIHGSDLKSQAILIPHGYIIYGKLRPYLNKYWTNETEFKDLVCSSEFFVFKIKAVLNKYFFMNVLASDIIQHQIRDKASGARMPRINETTFYNLEIPIPPIREQEIIANFISSKKSEIKSLRQKAKENLPEAIKEFEQEIFYAA